MAYRRYNRRGGYRYRPLRTRYIFSRTSARAQANQIYALKKKVNKLARKTKPDIKLSFIAPNANTFTNEALSSPYFYIPFSQIDQGSDDNQRVGNKVHCLGATYYLNFEYSDNLTTLEAKGCMVRIVAVQWKENKAYNAAVQAAGVIQDYSNTGDAYDLLGINPLKKDVTEYLHILKEMRFTLDESTPVKGFRFKFNPHDLRWDSSNNVNNFGLCIFVSGLHWISGSDMEAVSLTYSGKLAYTDM